MGAPNLSILIAILVVVATGIISPAFATIVVTIETDSDVYDHSSVITVTGNVDPVDPNNSPITIIVERVDPPGIVQFAQVNVNNDGSFSTTINTANPMMERDGTYLINAKYVNVDTTIAVELTNSVETYVTETTSMAETEISPEPESFIGQIEYDMTNADDSTLDIYIDATDDGVFTLTLHEEVIKPFEDGTFFVLVNDEEIQNFVQDGNTLIIPCNIGDEKISIIGSWAIPEFGAITVMIFVVAIIAIIVVSAKTKLSIISKY
jgi:predicted secreted protein with PEFG-CTERM motif